MDIIDSSIEDTQLPPPNSSPLNKNYYLQPTTPPRRRKSNPITQDGILSPFELPPLTTPTPRIKMSLFSPS